MEDFNSWAKHDFVILLDWRERLKLLWPLICGSMKLGIQIRVPYESRFIITGHVKPLGEKKVEDVSP